MCLAKWSQKHILITCSLTCSFSTLGILLAVTSMKPKLGKAHAKCTRKGFEQENCKGNNGRSNPVRQGISEFVNCRADFLFDLDWDKYFLKKYIKIIFFKIKLLFILAHQNKLKIFKKLI
jgi:hypothetical protein